MREPILRGAYNRILQLLASIAPGGHSVRVLLHRMRGVHIGPGSFIGAQAMIETSYPFLVTIGSRAVIGMRCLILGHFDGDIATSGVPEAPTVTIEDDVFVGPGALVMPNVTIGRGSVIAAGSVVTKSVPPGMFVRGNPAEVVARCRRPLDLKTSTWEFLRGLSPADSGSPSGSKDDRDHPRGH